MMTAEHLPTDEVASLEQTFDRIAEIIRTHGEKAPNELDVVYRGYRLHETPTSPAGPFDALRGPGLVVYRRRERPVGIGFMKRIDFRITAGAAQLAAALAALSADPS